MTFKGLVNAALLEIEKARENPIPEKIDFGYDRSHGFEIFRIPKEKTNCLQFFYKDSEFNVYYSLFRVNKVVQSRNERIILAIPGRYTYPIFRLSRLTLNSEICIGPYGFRGKRHLLLHRCDGMLVKDFEGNVFLTNTYRFNSKNVKSVLRLGLAIIDNYALTEAAHLNFFFSDYFGIGMNAEGEIIIINTRDYKPNIEWINIFRSLDCSDAAVIYSPDSNYFLRSNKGLSDVKTYGGYITYVVNKDDIRELIRDEMSDDELYKYYLLRR